MSSTRFAPVGPLRGSLRPPSDKSISHRAALIAAMGDGKSKVFQMLEAADTLSTLEAVRRLGATVERLDGVVGEPAYAIRGVGLRNACSSAIDVGNAGTLLRLLPGWLSGQVGTEWALDGDESIRKRPVDRIVEPLRRMGAQLRCHEDRLPPLEISGAPLQGIEYELPVASAQVKSCLLFAAMVAEGETRIYEPQRTRDHTERMLTAAGARISREDDVVVARPVERLHLGQMVVPADFSSAAFPLVAALLVSGSEVALSDVGLNPTRTGLLTILKRMGARIDTEDEGKESGERIGRLVAFESKLQATEVRGAEIPLAIDELPLVALAACFAEGTTVIRDAAELRRKESDRIETVTAALRALGGRVEPTEDGMVIEGSGGLRGGAINSHGDHRIAMLGAVAGLASREGVEVHGMEAAAVSYPGFEADLAALISR